MKFIFMPAYVPFGIIATAVTATVVAIKIPPLHVFQGESFIFLELVYCYYIYFVLSFSVPIPLGLFCLSRVFHFYYHYPHLFPETLMNKGFEG